MSKRAVTALSLGFAWLHAVPLASCGDDAGKPSRGSFAGTGGSGDAAAGNGGTQGGTGGTDAGDGAAGSDGRDSGSCGNGVRDVGEPCDGRDFGDRTCRTFGFDSGELECRNCGLILTSCSGDENCTDGNDNDFDGKSDCNDDDCAAACASSCSRVETLEDPVVINGETTGHASELSASCAGESGRELVYRFRARTGGVLDATLRSAFSANFSLSVRRSCSNAASETVCADSAAGLNGVERVIRTVAANEELFLVVDGSGQDQFGGFTLSARSRAIVCGDANRDPGEGCDDGNTGSGDGCSSVCNLEPDETESNDTAASATPFTNFPFYAAISAPNDVDFFSVTVADSSATLVAETFDLGDGACARLLLDSKVEILAPDGMTVLASNGDHGGTFCSRVVATELSAGKYYVRVTTEGTKPTFPYALNVTVRD